MSDHEHRPHDPSDDATFARLRSADPALDAELDLAAVRREVERRIVDNPVTATAVRPVPGRWLRVAAVAAAVALVGSAAFVVGRDTNGTNGSEATSGLVGTAPAAGIAVVPIAPAAGAGTRSESGASTDSRALIGWGGGRNHFVDGGLGTDGGTAEAWGYDPAQVYSAETADRIAAAMGVTGTATVQYQAWTVGAVDGSGPSVSVMGDGVGSVSYNDPQAYPSCDAPVTADAPGAGTDGVGVEEPGSACAPAGPELGGEDAIAHSSEVLGRIGLDPAGFRLTAPDDSAGGGSRTVVATAVLDGRDTGQQWSFTFVGDRLASFYGALAPAVGLGAYPVISPADAVARMNDPRFGATPGAYPIGILPAVDTPAVTEPGGDVTSVPAAPSPGAAIAWPVTEITLTSATLGLTSQYQADGATLLLPAYTMTDTTGATWTVLAVADDQLDFTG